MSASNLQLERDLENGQVKSTPREIVMKYFQHLPWFSLSIAVFLIGAYLQLRYSPRVYQVSASILVKDPNPTNSGSDKLDNILTMQPNKNINDEMQVMHSRGMATRVVHSLGYEVMYYNIGKIRTGVVYPRESPITLEILRLNDSIQPFDLQVFVIDEKTFSFTEKGQPLYFGQPFENSNGLFKLNRTEVALSIYASRQFVIGRVPAEMRGRELIGGLSVNQSGDATNILSLVYETENPKMGVDILDKFMDEYRKAGLEDKKEQAVGALGFINDQLVDVSKELGGAEQNLQDYREKNKVFDPTQQSSLYITSSSEIEKQITEQGVKIKVVEIALKYVTDTSIHYPIVVSSLGIEEPAFLLQIAEFNRLQVQRESLIKTTPRANPIVKTVDVQVEKLRQTMIENLKNIKAAYSLAMNELTSQSNRAMREMSLMPGKEKQLLDITRRQKILEELYSLLLQKKLETSISAASTISGVKVIEPALASGIPVRPNSKGVYTLAFFLGLLIPGAVIFMIEFLNDKVRSRNDVQRITDAPILGEIGHSNEGQTLVVTKRSRKFIAEQFRIIRTNLQYVLPRVNKQVLMVTSTVSGEGKTFVSINLGAVMALLGKKTVIFEFDIRKPKIGSTLGLQSKKGITNFLIGNASFEELPTPVPGTENLFIIPCGPVPPNPAELLFSEKLAELIAKAREVYDVVVIDTAPVGLVSDANTLGKFADATLYIIRHNHTFKKQLRLLNDIYTDKRLPKVSIVVNDIEKGPGYGYQYGYSYSNNSYGYGYGGGYFEEEEVKEDFFKRWKRRLAFWK